MNYNSTQIYINLDSYEAYIIKFISAGLWSVESEDLRIEAYTTAELLKTLWNTGLSL